MEHEGIRLVLVSVGKPQVGQELLTHLELVDKFGSDYLFVDPDNVLYNALDLNRGVQRTFFNINTPYSFLNRLTQPNGMQELGQVLRKWSKAIYVPPKNDQALLQGGTFVFERRQRNGNESDNNTTNSLETMKTLFAHYDPSTAAHASIDQVMDIARQAVRRQQQQESVPQLP